MMVLAPAHVYRAVHPGRRVVDRARAPRPCPTCPVPVGYFRIRRRIVVRVNPHPAIVRPYYRIIAQSRAAAW